MCVFWVGYKQSTTNVSLIMSSASRASSKLPTAHFHEDKLVLKEDINVDKFYLVLYFI